MFGDDSCLANFSVLFFTHLHVACLLNLLLLHCDIDLNETWQECCTTSLDVDVGRKASVTIMAEFNKSGGPAGHQVRIL